MSGEKIYSVTVEADEEGQFFRLPHGWLIEPENSDVIITHYVEDGTYHVQPVIGDDGQPNCRFIIPTNEAG